MAWAWEENIPPIRKAHVSARRPGKAGCSRLGDMVRFPWLSAFVQPLAIANAVSGIGRSDDDGIRVTSS
ncbi:hypothetical protein CUR86_20070 [Salinicola acroporae]|uniref:Uncharacterized protein n=1 Tax=Salinicola acroporae TaxID=1541440 RepID=A0ABT6I9T0_9GAMM|nr:hypothetical protein [Salinicola acroporae]